MTTHIDTKVHHQRKDCVAVAGQLEEISLSLQVTKAFVGAAEPLMQAGIGMTMSSGLVSLFSFALGGFGLAYLLSEQASTNCY